MATKSSTAANVDDARAAALSKFIARTSKSDPGAMFTFNGAALDVPVIPTGALSLDYALGVGGLPRGRIVECYGPESSGKTSLALSVAAQAIKAGGMAGIVDAEHAINPDHIKSMGVDPDYFAITQPSSGEEGLRSLESMINEKIFDVLIVDSVAGLVPESELRGEIGDSFVGTQARLMSQTLRKLTGPIAESQAVVIFINQLREKIGVLYGNPETTPGGKALKFYASVRLDVRSIASLTPKDRDGKTNIGVGTRVTVVKNKVAPPQKKAEYNLIWGKGIDAASSVFDVARDLGVLLEQSGNSYANALTAEVLADSDGKVIRGKQNVKDFLAANKEVAAQLEAACRLQMRATAEPIDAEGPIPDEVFEDAEEAIA